MTFVDTLGRGLEIAQFFMKAPYDGENGLFTGVGDFNITTCVLCTCENKV